MSSPTAFGDLDGVAIIGMAGRFPRARNITEFWRNLRDGVEAISFFTDEELQAAGIEPAVLQDPNYIKANGIVEDIELFDAPFFNLSPKEAESTDPQQRIFIECAWEALENAGYSCDNYDGLISVFAGVGINNYIANLQANEDRIRSLGAYKLMIGNNKDHLTMRVSYALDLRGPSFAVQSACSTSLVAIHLSCQGLLNYQFDMALAGGVTINAQQKTGYYYTEGLSSPDGHCRAFDAKANGFVGGNGAGIVVLKRLAEAVSDGDTIYAIIKGSAVNNDGRSKAGYSAPSQSGQASAIAMAQAAAEVDPCSISYIEAHGTATPMGDLIEMAALNQVFRASTNKKGFCAIGSVKTNVGHLDTASGVAGVIKTALALKHKQIPPTLHFQEPSPHIDLANSPFYVNGRLQEWKTDGTPRRAGVSAASQGGTNAHIILEEAPDIEPSGPSRPWQLLMLSAKTASALEMAIDNLADHLSQNAEQSLADAAYTLQVGRKSFKHRMALTCVDRNDAVAALRERDPRRLLRSAQEDTRRPVAFMFSGAGEQYPNMGLELYRAEPVFREQIDRCCELLKPHLGFDLKEAIYPGLEQSNASALGGVSSPASHGGRLDLRSMLRPQSRADEASERLKQTLLAQPALFVIEYALAQLWLQWGVRPQAMIGYSIGEYVAACIAGVFSLENALFLVAKRAQMIQGSPGGAMLTVPLPAHEVHPLLGQELSLAAITSPSVSVVAGPAEAISELEQRLGPHLVHRRVQITHAFHSKMLEPIAEQFAREINIPLSAPQIPFVSNVTGTWITDSEATSPAYWARHMCHTVRFMEGIASLRKERDLALLEVGPGQSLVTAVIQHPTSRGIADTVALASLRHSYDRQSDTGLALNTLGKLWLAGAKIDWSGFYNNERRRRVPLPTYPFERQRYWLERGKQSSAAQARQPALETRADVADWFYLPVWKQSLAPAVADGDGPCDGAKCWLVFLDSCGLGRKLVERLRKKGYQVVTVTAGGEFCKLDDNAYQINHQEPTDYLSLLSDMQAQGKLPGRITHLWSLTADEQYSTGREFFAKAQTLGFYSLLFLTQSLIKKGLAQLPAESDPGSCIHLQVISNNVHQVTGEEKLCPEKATILGPCKSIPQEYPGISCLSVDISLAEPDGWQESRLLDNLMAELEAKASNSIIAYRGSVRWTQTFEPIRLEAKSAEPKKLKQHGVYLMTGGLGNDSLVRARYLAEAFKARLVLLGRHGLPEREDWQQWLACHDEQDEVSIKISKVQELLELGAEVLIVSADAGDESQMRSAMEQIDEKFGALDGVIHAAGLTDPAASRLISELGSVESEWQFQAKVYGLYALEKVLRGRDLDFCLLTSSVASIIGGVGLLAYTSANIFMDAFAHMHNQKAPVFWVSLNWQGTSPENTVEAFKRVLSMPPATQVVVSIEDLQARINQRINLAFLRGAERAAQPPVARPNLRNAHVAASTETERKLTDMWHSLLGVDWLGIHDSFLEVGGDSLLAVQLFSRVSQAFGVKLTLQSLFETPTIASLAQHIDQSLQKQVAEKELPMRAAAQDKESYSPETLIVNSSGPLESGAACCAAVSQQSELAARSSLVGLQTHGSRPPFFCAHPSGGNVFCFLQLARHLGDEQPFYAFQSRGLNKGQRPHARVEDMADFYIEALRSVKPSGPYLLGGWSMGGLVAFEMAQRLRARGEEVALLALLDTPVPDNNQHPTEISEVAHLINFAHELALSWGLEISWSDLDLNWDAYSGLSPNERLNRILTRAREIGAIPADMELLEGERLLEIFRANAEAMRRYNPQPYTGRVTLIRTNDQSSDVYQDSTLGWGELAAEGVDLHIVGGSHYSMVRDPFARDLAAVLEKCLRLAVNNNLS